ncbi:hypothetical protein BUALT_Bualt15G0121800 [Buddleja alternifolia]|uniref:Mannan endo-1,4-beta-mannosidase n=1 Tax=Buddleja alternifolia TaxID=168488 RepID=A0AAV6WMT5_9LAMI|nr:hypothetical protein BUALT_Bualt15G0121800 [Buddleja alternifolia]
MDILARVAIDVHYYNLFSSMFNSFTVEQHIEYVNSNRSAQLSEITTSNGPLTFVGEWVAALPVIDARKEEYYRKEDYQTFADAQLQVFNQATFGWAYWGLKTVNNYWNLEWMINNGYIKL